MKSEKDCLHFLIYDNRSGSTYLSAMLDGVAEIGVSLESRVLFSLMSGKDKYGSEAEIDTKLSQLYADPRFGEWNVPIAYLRDLLVRSLPITKKDFVYLVVKSYFDIYKPRAKCLIYKGSSPYLMKELKQIFPEAKFVFLYRDGRAVFCSKRRSISLNAGDVMARDPIRSARMWSRYIAMVNRMPFQNDIIRVKYEDFIIDTNVEFEKLCKYLLGDNYFGGACTPDTAGYHGKIPSSQAHLHRNVVKKPLRDRIEGWKSEITFAEGYLYEKAAKNVMRQMGYQVQYIDRSMSENDRREIQRLYMKIIFYRCRHLARRLLFHSSQPRGAISMLIYKFRSLF